AVAGRLVRAVAVPVVVPGDVAIESLPIVGWTSEGRASGCQRSDRDVNQARGARRPRPARRTAIAELEEVHDGDLPGPPRAAAAGAASASAAATARNGER